MKFICKPGAVVGIITGCGGAFVIIVGTGGNDIGGAAAGGSVVTGKISPHTLCNYHCKGIPYSR